ncbi:Glutamate--cysteine ligase regulatory subunit [Melipona quadrifasciata]|uniref:GCS light chain n=1 Tax=Melipona quadrifasciata TaxID=166423 RepID=A0A0N1ITR4_9HYME|nr:Glutamate--cysteine ligase regulatory subunit [Melipona quadrifasciata]
MLSQNILVRTGNILSLNEAKTKASQNPTDEFSMYHNHSNHNSRVCNSLNINAIESLVIAYLSKENPEELLASLKHLWIAVEEYVKIGKLSSVGLSDVDTNVFIDLFQWANIKPNIVQISLATCCVVPPALQTFSKENDIQLLTHNDPGQILPEEDLNGIFNANTNLYWVTRYQIHLKCRGILSSKGYLVYVSKKTK